MSESNTERTQSKVFGEVAELYHAVRPDYPDGLYNWMIETSSVNGHDLNSISSALNAFDSLQSERSFNFEVTTRKKKKTYEYEVR